MTTTPATEARATRSYDVVALRVPIVYDTYGDHDRDGRIYTLAKHEAKLREIGRTFPDPFPDPLAHPQLLPKPHPLVRPLVLRARVGERLKIRFRNRLPHRTGIHVQGVGYDVKNADGGAVGRNPDSSVEPGGSRTYLWDCTEEGTFWFGDIADLRGQEDAGNARGLFGALVVEPKHATWTDPVTGEPLTDGLYADVHVPGEPSFREYVVHMHDETSNDNPARRLSVTTHADNSRDESESDGHGSMSAADHGRDDADEPHPVDHSVMLLNYRTEPMGGRLQIYQRLLESGHIDPERDRIVGEEQHHSSWLFGDPSTPILRAYRGDRAKIRLLMAGVKETHVFHLHVHQWRAVPGNDDSPLLDSVSIGPQQAFTIEPLGGAGSVQKATGDVIFHCHLYPHFHSGMWGMWRIFDVLQDGGGRYPDGTTIVPLRPLPGHEPPPAPTPRRPGWPAFMDGRYPGKSPRPPRTPLMPDGIGRDPSELEQNAFVDDPQPGEAFTKVAPADAPLRVYDLVVMEGKVVYHDSAGSRWDDERGVFYVLKEQVDEAGGVEEFQRQLEEGARTVEPIAIRANKGEVIQLSLTNALPPGRHDETDFDPVLPFQPECGLHVHLVKFDPLVSDGSSVGWNYLSGATTEDQGKEDYLAYNTWIFRWYCDEEFGTIFFHDHLLANERQRHGLFGAMIAEPAGSQWTDERGNPVTNANRAVVRLADGSAFREQVLAIGDFVPLYRSSGDGQREPVNPPAIPGDLEDHGAMAFNYRCEPLRERPGDPADWFDSGTHRDPKTPMLRAYPGESLRLRLYQGSHEEQHSFRVHGMRWNTWFTDPSSPPRDQQTLGISEAFTMRIDDPHGPGDYLWGLGTADDLWMGAWGLIRLHETEQPDLPRLPGAFDGSAYPKFNAAKARRYRVSVHDDEIHYSSRRSDPLAARYTVDGLPDGQPLILRCRVGEWVEIVLTNELRKPLRDSSYDPKLSALDEPGDREISPRVSLHPSGILRYDVRRSDGSNVGRNADSTAAPSDASGSRWQIGFNEDGTIRDAASVVYRWYADTPGVVLLEDRADVRTHKHRGLIGALVVEAADATPLDPETGRERWVGEQVVVRAGRDRVRELVLLLQDGLRLYHEGDESQPVTDLEDEPADAGQKGFNYRSAHLVPRRPSLAVSRPETPILDCSPGDTVRVHLAMATDRARNHTFQIHGHTFPMEQHVERPRVGAIGALSVGSLRSVTFTAGEPGDYAYRAGVLRWHLSEGVWGLIRVRE